MCASADTWSPPLLSLNNQSGQGMDAIHVRLIGLGLPAVAVQGRVSLYSRYDVAS